MSITQDRPCTCMFVFADGRRCQMPPSADDIDLSYFYARTHRDHLSAQEAGQQINEFLSSDILTACDLSAALTTLFSAAALGLIKPKATIALTYLGNLMLQTQKLAKKEFLESFDDRWPKIVEEAPAFNPLEPEPTPAPAATQPTETTLITQMESPADTPAADPNVDPAEKAPHPIPFPKIM